MVDTISPEVSVAALFETSTRVEKLASFPLRV